MFRIYNQVLLKACVDANSRCWYNEHSKGIVFDFELARNKHLFCQCKNWISCNGMMNRKSCLDSNLVYMIQEPNSEDS